VGGHQALVGLGRKGYVKILLLVLFFSVNSLTAWAQKAALKGPPVMPAYQKCSQENGYLEKDLKRGTQYVYLQPRQIEEMNGDLGLCDPSKSKNPMDKWMHDNSIIVGHNDGPSREDRACIFQAQANSASPSGYAKCANQNSNLKVSRERPCISKNYVELTARAFRMVTACTGASPRELFGLFLQESGFHLNALSWTGALGVGQLTTPGVKGVQQVEDDFAETPLYKATVERIDSRIKNKPYCKPLIEADELTLSAKEIEKSCSILSFPRNPTYPILLSTKLYLYQKALIEDYIKSHAAFDRFKPSTRVALAKELALYAYNAGVGGVLATFVEFAKPKVKESHVKSTEELLNNFSEFVRHHFPAKSAKKNELADHVRPKHNKNGIYHKLSKIDGLSGVQCFKE